MKFITSNCPKCGQPAVAILERLYAWASLYEENGAFDYAGESDVDWDSQEPVETDKQVDLTCDNKDEWSSDVEEW